MRHDPTAQPLTMEFERTGLWWHALWLGFFLYITGVLVLDTTHNVKLFPAVSMLGSFLVPVAYVIFIYEHRRLSSLSPWMTAMSFLYGGILGVFGAALIEPMFIRKLTFLSAFEVGLIEEGAKIIGVIVIATHHRHASELNGLILGAAAGMGFAALESNGYAFAAFLQSKGNLSLTVIITLFRGVLSPLGHGTWTAILAAVLFRESTARRFRFDWQVIGAYLLVSVLHGLWDGLPSALSILSVPGANIFIGQFIVGGTGIYILWRRWREAVRRQLTWTVVPEIDEPIE